MVSEQTLNEITRRLVDKFHPVSVILFGSQARGTSRDGSDIDLIVICEHFANRNDLEASMYAALRGIDVPIDVLVFTPEEFAAERDLPGTFAQPAAREGRVLYGRAA